MNPNLKLSDIMNFGAAEMMRSGGPDRVAQNFEMALALLFTHGIPALSSLFSSIFG